MADNELHEFVLNLERSVWQAVIRKDGAALEKLFSDNYIEITLEGKRVPKAAVVTESPQIDEIDRYAIEADRVVALGNDCILLSYHLTLDGSSRGEVISPRERWATSIWSRQSRSWQCCLFQQSHFEASHIADD